MTAILAAAGVFLLFGLTIFVHELGHFLTARRLGFQVTAFSIGMGPALLRWKRGGVEYKLGIVPFGGYVTLPQMEPWAAEEDAVESLPQVSWWKKLLVGLSGAAGNLGFAFIVSTVIWVAGKPAAPAEYCSVVGYVATNSEAWAAGLRPGDEVIAVNGEPVRSWEDVVVLSSLREQVELLVRSGDAGEEKRITLQTEKTSLGLRVVAGIGPMEYCKVLDVRPGSSAEQAGIRPADLIVWFNGQKVYSIAHLIELVDQARDRQVPIGVERDGKLQELRVTPRYDKELGRALIGVQFNPYYVGREERVHPLPWDQMKRHLLPVFRIIRALLTPSEARQAAAGVGGPIMILWSLWAIIQESFVMALWFTAFLNVNLAVINLLPMPILDGSHVVYALYEGVRRRPVNRTVVETLTYAFFVILVWVFLTISVRDVHRIWRPGRSGAKPAGETGEAR